jgi:Ni,Fe-hydrogenase III component G
MNEEKIIESIKENLGSKVLAVTTTSERRLFLTVSKNDLSETVRFLRDKWEYKHLSTITGLDKTDNFELLYHFANALAVITVRISVPRTEPIIKSICEIIPGAVLYERELQDMFGIKVENIPDPRPLVLPDGWPEENFPLRKDWAFARPPEVIPNKDKK